MTMGAGRLEVRCKKREIGCANEEWRDFGEAVAGFARDEYCIVKRLGKGGKNGTEWWNEERYVNYGSLSYITGQ